MSLLTHAKSVAFFNATLTT